jgi:predicted ATPase with chaperone activity
MFPRQVRKVKWPWPPVPVDLKKEGPAHDLQIALAIVMSLQQGSSSHEREFYLAEFSLDGDFRHTDGILPIAPPALTLPLILERIRRLW